MDNYKKETINSYNKNSKELSRKFRKLFDLKRRRDFSVFFDLLSGNKILDLGCGSGDHAYYFSKKGLDVTCVDLSEKMIESCK